MPQELGGDILEIGGKSTDLARRLYAERMAKVREITLRNSPRYRDITGQLDSSDYRGTLSKPAAGYAAKRKVKGMPKILDISTVNAETVAGKRGRKAVFPNFHEWVMEIGASADISEEMNSEILAEDYEGDLTPEFLFDNENADGVKYRKARFNNMVTAARKANGEKSKYSLLSYKDAEGNSGWAIRRDS